MLNPIHVARVVLDESTRPLSLRRVPPNLLVGTGAVDYAFSHNVPILPNDALVSPAAKERWLKWSRDLQAVQQQDSASQVTDQNDIAALRNEGQTTSPLSSAGGGAGVPPPMHSERGQWAGSGLPLTSSSPSNNVSDTKLGSSSDSPIVVGDSNGDPISEPLESVESVEVNDGNNSTSSRRPLPGSLFSSVDQDLITDTVGAIAIDCYGRMAAGSSSGGIGMKFKGRIGPAALVGVGTAVVPVNPRDKDRTSVAAVTSGTGEHMATTMAAHTCASRLYHNQSTSKRGILEKSFEEEAIQNFIRYDFMSEKALSNTEAKLMISRAPLRRCKPFYGRNWGHGRQENN